MTLLENQQPVPGWRAEMMVDRIHGALIEGGFPHLVAQVWACPEGGGSEEWAICVKGYDTSVHPWRRLAPDECAAIERAGLIAGVDQ